MSRLDELLAAARGYVMTPFERRAQAISWAVGNVLCMRSAQNNPAYDEWALRLRVAKQWDEKYGPA